MATRPSPDFPFDIVGFDLDGTLLDTSADLGHALNHALRQAGRAEVPMSEVRALIGGGTRQMLGRALALTGDMPDEPEMSRLSDLLVDHYEANIAHHTALFPGGGDMLDSLAARGVHLAVVTNKMERLALRLLDEVGLSPRFYTIIGGDTLGRERAKPRPDLLLEMLSRAPTATGTPRAAYVGDTTFDTRAASAAGLPCVVYAGGFCDLPPAELGATAVIDHYDDLVPTLESL